VDEFATSSMGQVMLIEAKDEAENNNAKLANFIEAYEEQHDVTYRS
jgi:hypothetical protein